MIRLPEARTRSPLHVCFVCNELPPATAGGIGYCVLTTARGLAARGHRVTVAGAYDRDYEWRIPGVEVKWVRDGGAGGAGRARTVWRLAKLVNVLRRREGVEVVEWPDFQGLFLRRTRGALDVVRTHGPSLSHAFEGLARTHPLTAAMEMRTLRTIPNWIGTSQWFMEEWLRIARARPVRRAVVYNPVDCGLFRPATEGRERPLILYAGRLWKRKGVFALAEAARLFLPHLPGVCVGFVGADPDGTARAEAARLAGEQNAGKIWFSDPLPQAALAGLMRECMVFAMPSILESFGNAWAEAMSSGVPVVGSRRSCGPEIVPDGEAGILCDPADPAEIAEAVMKLARSEALRRELGARGREVALARYSVTASVERTEAFYRHCLDEDRLGVAEAARGAEPVVPGAAIAGEAGGD